MDDEKKREKGEGENYKRGEKRKHEDSPPPHSSPEISDEEETEESISPASETDESSRADSPWPYPPILVERTASGGWRRLPSTGDSPSSSLSYDPRTIIDSDSIFVERTASGGWRHLSSTSSTLSYGPPTMNDSDSTLPLTNDSDYASDEGEFWETSDEEEDEIARASDAIQEEARQNVMMNSDEEEQILNSAVNENGIAEQTALEIIEDVLKNFSISDA